MVDLSSARLDRVFRALADPTRRRLLDRLLDGEATVSTLAEPFDMSLAAVSKHIKILEAAELLVQERRGRERHCRLRTTPLHDVADVVAHYASFWTQRLDRLDATLQARKGKRT